MSAPARQRFYHFDCGDSNSGPVGYCAMIRAASPEEAVERLRAMLPEGQVVEPVEGTLETGEYLRVYFNWTQFPTVAQIDAAEEE